MPSDYLEVVPSGGKRGDIAPAGAEAPHSNTRTKKEQAKVRKFVDGPSALNTHGEGRGHVARSLEYGTK